MVVPGQMFAESTSGTIGDNVVKKNSYLPSTRFILFFFSIAEASGGEHRCPTEEQRPVHGDGQLQNLVDEERARAANRRAESVVRPQRREAAHVSHSRG